jgi:hypothetical protein
MAPLWLLGLGVVVLPILLHYVRCSHTGESNAKPPPANSIFRLGGGRVMQVYLRYKWRTLPSAGPVPFPIIGSAHLRMSCPPPPFH